MAAADIGCGAGSTAAYLTDRYGLDMVGLDISEQLVRAGLENRPGLKLIRWDCRTLPFKPSSLDAVLLECTLSVIGGIPEMLRECAQALKPAGTLILSDIFAERPAGGPAA
jgi:ubiquinone/menaquinone biosynthesis C-methylase UbiE